MKGTSKLTILTAASVLALSAPVMAQQGGGQQQGGTGGNMTWQQEQAQGTGTSLTLSPATVRQVQQALNNAGFDAGNVDGQFGKQTQQALADYQRSQGLEPTGNLNRQTLQALNIRAQGGSIATDQGQIGGGQAGGGAQGGGIGGGAAIGGGQAGGGAGIGGGTQGGAVGGGLEGGGAGVGAEMGGAEAGAGLGQEGIGADVEEGVGGGLGAEEEGLGAEEGVVEGLGGGEEEGVF